MTAHLLMSINILSVTTASELCMSYKTHFTDVQQAPQHASSDIKQLPLASEM